MEAVARWGAGVLMGQACLPMEAERGYLPLGGGGPAVQCSQLRVAGMWAISPFKEIRSKPALCVYVGSREHILESGALCGS